MIFFTVLAVSFASVQASERVSPNVSELVSEQCDFPGIRALVERRQAAGESAEKSLIPAAKLCELQIRLLIDDAKYAKRGGDLEDLKAVEASIREIIPQGRAVHLLMAGVFGKNKLAADVVVDAPSVASDDTFDEVIVHAMNLHDDLDRSVVRYSR